MVKVLSVLTSSGLLGGVGVWSLRMSGALAASREVHWETLILRNESEEDQSVWFLPAEFPGISFFDYDSRDRKDVLRAELRRRLAECDVLIPNYVLAAWEAAADLKQANSGPYLVNVIHSDHSLFYTLARNFAPVLDGIVAVSSECARAVAQHASPRDVLTVTIPYGVPVPRQVPSKPVIPPLRLVYAGRLSHHQKRVSLLVDFCAALRERDVPFVLDIYGKGPAEQDLRRALEPFDGVVCWHGPARLNENSRMFQSSHLQVLFSDHEGLPLAILEGMAWGVVPIVTDVRSGIPELVEDGETGFRVPVDQPVPRAVDIVASLVRTPQELDRISLRCHRVIYDRFGLERAIRDWTGFLERLTATSPRRAPCSWVAPSLNGFGRRSILDRPFMPRWMTLLLRRLRHPVAAARDR